MRSLNNEKVEAAWRDVYSYRPAPTVITVPLRSYIAFAMVALAQLVALLIIWPNP